MVTHFPLMSVYVRHLFVSPGHNFFGHHGLPPGEHPAEERERVMCRAGRGLEGDRFFDYKQDYRGQITFFDFETFREAQEKFNLPRLPASAFRRNALVEGLAVPGLMGSRFVLGGVEFEGTTESSPCHWMNHAVAPGAEEWLRGRGGLRAKILTDGVLAVGPAKFLLLRGQMSLA